MAWRIRIAPLTNYKSNCHIWAFREVRTFHPDRLVHPIKELSFQDTRKKATEWNSQAAAAAGGGGDDASASASAVVVGAASGAETYEVTPPLGGLGAKGRVEVH